MPNYDNFPAGYKVVAGHVSDAKYVNIWIQDKRLPRWIYPRMAEWASERLDPIQGYYSTTVGVGVLPPGVVITVNKRN